MALEPKHKVIFGGLSSLIIIFMIVTSILLFNLYTKQQQNYIQLDREISNLRNETQTNINELTRNLILTRESLNQDITDITSQMSELKASVSEDFSGIIDESVPSVVTVRTASGQGTGFIITDDGYFVTNAHVITSAKSIEAITSEQKVLKAKLIGYDENLDIALLKISGTYNALKLANSDDVQVGEKVIAIGNPLGLQFSVSQGIVSGVKREGSNGLNIYIQTDAALNPGNSGGPLINQEGKVIGINNFKIGDSENLGFALESNYIRYSVNRISLNALNQSLID